MSTTAHEFQPEEVMAFLDGELSAARAAVVAEHVNTCTDCAALVADFRQVSQHLNVWGTEPSPAQIEGRVDAALAEHLAAGQTLANRETSGKRWFGLRTWVWQLAAGSALGLLLISIAIPNLLRSKMAANESSAVGALRILQTAVMAYTQAYGHYPPSLRALGPSADGKSGEDGAGLIDSVLASGQKSGYRFVYETAGEGYAIGAYPVAPGDTGKRYFSMDQQGTIYAGLSRGSTAMFVGQAAFEINDEKEVKRQASNSPMIARSAELTVAVKSIEAARKDIDRILDERKGHIAQLTFKSPQGDAKTLSAILRVPAPELNAALTQLKQLGRVERESQGGEEITQLYVDLTARLKNAHNTEAQLNDVLRQHAGKVKDILEVEKESTRVREEIERMDAERKSMENRVQFATLTLTLTEEYNAQLNLAPLSTGGRLRNAVVEGYRDMTETALGIVLFFLQYGPSLLLWAAILFWPARLAWRRLRPHLRPSLEG